MMKENQFISTETDVDYDPLTMSTKKECANRLFEDNLLVRNHKIEFKNYIITKLINQKTRKRGKMMKMTLIQSRRRRINRV